MKKILLILALALATALPSVAESFSPGGKWDNQGSASLGLPVDVTETNSVSQTIFTYADLQKIAPQTDSSGALSKAEIKEIQFNINVGGPGWLSGSADFKVFVENVEKGKEFPKNGTKYEWLEYGQQSVGELTLLGKDIQSYYDNTGEETFPVSIPLTVPVIYDGGDLLVTMICVNNTYEDIYGSWTNGTYSYTSVNGTKSNYQSNITEPKGLMSGSPKTRGPIVNFVYTTITEAAEGTPVTLENIALAVEDYKADPALGQGSSVSNIAIRFDVNDPTNCGEYEIKVDDSSIGYIHSTSGTINFLGMPKQDVKLSVIPKGEGTSATDKTIDISEFEALFPNPEVSVVKTALYGSYEVLTARSVALEGAAQFKLTTPIKSAVFNTKASENATKLMTTDGSYPESLEALVPENATYTDWKYVGLNDGLISYYKQNALTLSADKGVIKDFDKSATITVKFAVDYPVVSGTPVLVEGRGEYVADGDYAVAGTGFSFTNVNRVYNNGSTSSYNAGQLSARLNAAEEGVLTLDLEYPRNFTSEINNDKSVTFYAPAGHTIWYAFVPNTTVATFALDDTLEWQQAETNPFTVSFADLGSGTIHAKAVKESGEETEVHSYNINNDGEISGIESVEIDGVAAVEYFNLQGVRVENPQGGLFIRRQGNKAAKVYVK